MAVIKETTINTGSMTFNTINDIDSFIVTIPTLKRSVDLIALARHMGQVTNVEAAQISPTEFYNKTTFFDQASYDAVTANADISGVSIALEALGWTINRTISYTYD